MTAPDDPLVRELGQRPYRATFEAMRHFTAARDEHTRDEIWLLEHAPVYTLGLGARGGLAPANSDIPVEQIDRGGQITYHGPGQLVMYVLLDLVRRQMRVHRLVALLEQSVIDLLASYEVRAIRRSGAPGVYVADAKIAALGLKVRRGASYHGLALNVCMDLAPFGAIDPCGYPGLAVTQTATLGIDRTPIELGRQLAAQFTQLIRSVP